MGATTFDIPGTVSDMYRILNAEIAPVFREGRILTETEYANAPPASSAPIHPVATNPVTPAVTTFVSGTIPAVSTPGPSVAGPVNSVPVHVGNRGNGMLIVPEKYRQLQRNYLPVSGGAPKVPFGQQTPKQPHSTPLHMPPTFTVPPPPKRMCIEGTNAVRSLFGTYTQPDQTPPLPYSNSTNQNTQYSQPQGTPNGSQYHGNSSVYSRLPPPTHQPRTPNLNSGPTNPRR